MSPLNAIFLGLCLLLWAWFCRWIMDNPRGDPVTGLILRGMEVYSALVHRVRYEGLEHVPAVVNAGPLVVVCNHTAGIDPVLVQAGRKFEVRWMMATDMRVPALEPIWELAHIIGVNRVGRDTTSAREALRHLRSGGVLGVFPEGGIERPHGTLRKFHPGVGFIVSRSGAPVLPVWIRGTPRVPRAWESFWTPSRSVVRFGPLMRFPESATPEDITHRLREWFRETSGWPDSAA